VLADDTVVSLARLPTPLPLDARRPVSLLCMRTRVNHADRVLGVMFIRHQMLQHLVNTLMIPHEER